jgi:ADP-heptose:LPS heptosyltransferase
MKILIIRFSSIGDIVLTTPVVRCLKKQTGAEVHYLTKKSFEKILLSNPYIDRVLSIEKDVSEVLDILKSMQYDYIIDLHKNLRTLHIKWSLGVKSYSFDKLNIEKWLMVHFKINRLPNTHIVDRYMATLKNIPLGASGSITTGRDSIFNDNEGLDYFIPQEDTVNMAQYVENSQPYIAFVIGAAHATKRLPNEKIIEICNQIDYPILLIGGKEDAVNGDVIVAKAKGNVQSLCGKLNLNQSASVVQHAHKVIAHDTGLMHIAAAFKKDIISIWGNTVPEFGMYPYVPFKEEDIKKNIIEVKGLACRPCSKIGHHECPKGNFRCMNDINTEGVAARVGT